MIAKRSKRNQHDKHRMQQLISNSGIAINLVLYVVVKAWFGVLYWSRDLTLSAILTIQHKQTMLLSILL